MSYDRRAADTNLTLKGTEAKKLAKEAQALQRLVASLEVNLKAKKEQSSDVQEAIDDLEEASLSLNKVVQLLTRAGLSLEGAGSTR